MADSAEMLPMEIISINNMPASSGQVTAITLWLAF